MTRTRILLLLSGLAAAACATILDLEAPPDGGFPEAGAFDGISNDVVIPCASLDAGLPGADAAAFYRPFEQFDIDDAGDQSLVAFDLTSVVSNAISYNGGTFDGTYLYLVPNGAAPIIRYNTTMRFDTAASWSTFDPSPLVGSANHLTGAVFDGRYVMFVPGDIDGGIVPRYDTSGSNAFQAGAWSTFDMGTVPFADSGVGLHGFQGATFDGRFVYFTPYRNGTIANGVVARFDTQGDGGSMVPDGGDAAVATTTFDTKANWTTFDITRSNGGAAGAVGFQGAVFDGKYAYFVPAGNNPNIARFDTTQPFTAPSSWQTFNLVDNVTQQGFGFTGAAFDGRFIYLVPHGKPVAVRYDTSGSFTDASSWVAYDLSLVTPGLDGGNPSFAGAGFDGRFIYYMPEVSGLSTVVRYDRLSKFTSPCAWSTADLTTAQGGLNAGQTWGAAFDGRYMYFLPRRQYIVRFDARIPRAFPALPEFHGSFY